VPPPALHPPTDRLLAFGLGQLDLLDAVALEAHLQHCDSCCAHLDRLPADGLVSALRLAARAPAADSWGALTRKQIPGLTGAAPPSPVPPGEPGFPPELEKHPRYRVAALVGRGGMGTVYRAEHTLMGRPVALKVIDPHLLEHAGALARFRQEVMAAARLSHPNIVIAYDAEQVGSHHVLVMEFVEGTNLADYLRARGRLGAGEACGYVRQAALGLQHAFERGMVHRDIKPHNLMLTPDGQVKVLDFGLARFLFEQAPDADAGDALDDTAARCATCAAEDASGLTPAGSMMGTLDYMPPEQARDARRADIRADIYSLGCTLYQLLTGQVPFPGGDAGSKAARLASESPAPLARLRPDLPKGLAAVVARMMARRPEDRYQTPAAVAAALAPFTDAPGRKSLKRRLAAVLALALTVLTAGAVALRVQTEQGDPAQPADQDRVTKLVRQLGDRLFAKREAASKELEALGAAALPALRRAVASDDPEVRRRADTLVPVIIHRLDRTDVKSVPAPKGAIVLFGGKNLDAWVGRDGATDPTWRLLDGGVLEAHAADIRTRQTFAGGYKLHVEFRIPPNPADTVVGPGNSGVYLHGKYEVQILDSYGPQADNPKITSDRRCGSIYGQTAPRVNVCKAPGCWQSYDIEFHPPRFKDGRKEAHPRVTVFHNGVLIHDNVHVLVDDTGQGLPGHPVDPGPVLLQYHLSPVQFRNIWLMPLQPERPARADPAEILRLVRQLGSPKLKEREAAERRLNILGAPALLALRKAAAGDDPDVRRRAEALIASITPRLAGLDIKSVPAPQGAVVLFDGKSLDAWVGRDGMTDPTWKLLDGGVLEAHAADIRTRQTFADGYKLHVEFRIPSNPADTPVGRGNSGVYLHGNYEVQILDSYGPRAKEPRAVHSAPVESCGAIFGQTAPRVNACKAPGHWQSYDIEFHPPRFKDGRKEAHPRVTVFHNGVLIHENVPILVDGTGHLGLKGDLAQPGPVMLQYHQSPVQFRNIWLVPLKPEQPAGADAEEVKRLIRQLGSPKFAERKAAERRLAAIGAPALPALRQAADDKVAEIRARAARLLEEIDRRLSYFFNGKDLKRWQGLPGCWSVRDGALVGTTEPGGLPFNTFLCSEKKYRDFELRFRVRVTGKGWPGNSGVQIRSAVIDSTKWVVRGPQCDMGDKYWGCLYGEQSGGMMKEAPLAVVAPRLKPEGFNDYYIKCVGKRVTIKLNGHATVDEEFAQLPAEGIIAWQLHGGQPMTVTFRDIVFKDLSKK
jgi:hypothetical protein